MPFTILKIKMNNEEKVGMPSISQVSSNRSLTKQTLKFKIGHLISLGLVDKYQT